MLCYIHPEDQEQAKEGYYLREQSPFFGSYINNRQKFDIDWAAGAYEPTYCIRLKRDEVQITGQIGSTWTRREETEEEYIEL
ncbi:hypothetical protein [Anaerocolumna chitinilytica]|uniref:Uncharacterized protein n=1 Tax=Anaerocolumna chitinilytica TaxID=1727145 RepID=A0A7M3SA07_9FIRM|nr:hypothetical protein [Anaerocolumna chitinilytica]BCK01425.1 hypothetical protein bsdcttw_44650 [Anaerocolumna chitinilytica]